MSHSRLLLRSLKGDPANEEDFAARIDLLFTGVEALSIRSLYQELTLEVATEERATQIPDRLGTPHREDRVVELVAPDGSRDYIGCTSGGWHQDGGEHWEPKLVRSRHPGPKAALAKEIARRHRWRIVGPICLDRGPDIRADCTAPRFGPRTRNSKASQQ